MGAVSYLATSGYCMSLNHPKFGRPNEANLENILKRSKTFLNENLYQPHKIHKGMDSERPELRSPSLTPALLHLSPAVGSAAAHDLLVRVRARTRPADGWENGELVPTMYRAPQV